MIISRTPLRISFVGGGTDMEYFYKKYQGRVISMPIDKYIYIIVKKRFDEKIVLKYRKTEIVSSTEEIKHELSQLVLFDSNKENSNLIFGSAYGLSEIVVRQYLYRFLLGFKFSRILLFFIGNNSSFIYPL